MQTNMMRGAADGRVERRSLSVVGKTESLELVVCREGCDGVIREHLHARLRNKKRNLCRGIDHPDVSFQVIMSILAEGVKTAELRKLAVLAKRFFRQSERPRLL